MNSRAVKRTIGEVMKWSSRCREHFFPWRMWAEGSEDAESIAEAGITESHPGYCLERKSPRFHLLVYPIEGTGTVYTQHREYSELGLGQLLIAPAAQSFGYVPETDKWRFMWFHLPDNEAWRHLKQRKLSVRKTVLSTVLQKTMEEFLVESRGRSESHRSAARLYIGLISVYIQRELSSEKHGAVPDQRNRLDHLLSLINADLAREWTVEGMAAAIWVSSPHLYRLIREHFGGTPMRLVTRLRMERAQELLIMHDVAQRVIAEMVGYQNEFAFAVAFKRFSGVTPGDFRKRR